MSANDFLGKFRNEYKLILAQSILRLENIECNDVQTRQLLECASLPGRISDDDAIIIRNMLNALDFLGNIDLSTISLDEKLFIKINSILARDQAAMTGSFRTGMTNIDCIPENIPAPDLDAINNEIKRLQDIEKNNFRKSIGTSFANLARMQPFYDGNKRSALFLCNVAMFKKELGIFTIPSEKYPAFIENLRNFYMNKNMGIVQFIADELIISAQDMKSRNDFLPIPDKKMQNVIEKLLIEKTESEFGLPIELDIDNCCYVMRNFENENGVTMKAFETLSVANFLASQTYTINRHDCNQYAFDIAIESARRERIDLDEQDALKKMAQTYACQCPEPMYTASEKMMHIALHQKP